MASSQIALSDGWMLQSSRKVDEKADVLSKPTFQPKGWYPVTVPTTVVGALVKHKVLPDPTYGMNLRQMGVTYPIGANFSNIAMAPDSPYLLVVVPEGIRSACQLQGKDGVAEFSRNQLPREHPAEREQIAKSDDVAELGVPTSSHITDSVLSRTFWPWSLRAHNRPRNHLCGRNPAPPD